VRKWKCRSFDYTLIAILIFGFNVLPGILGYKVYVKYQGWEKVSLKEGIFLTLLSLFIYILGKKVCVEPIVYKCPKCKEVFCERDAKNGKCPNCLIDMIDVKEYYKESLFNNKN